MVISRKALEKLGRVYYPGIDIRRLAAEADCSVSDAAYYVQRKTLKAAVLVLMLQGMTKQTVARKLGVSYFVLKSALEGKYDGF